MTINWRCGRRKAAGAAAAIVIATAAIAGFEGYVPYVYRDAVGVQTYCYGETKNPQPGHRYTKQECTAKLKARVEYFDKGVRRYIHVPLPAKTEAAFISFAYNVGLGAFGSSTLVRLANAGDLVGACNQLPRWNKAGGRVLKGLTVRRGEERELCLEGVREASRKRTG